MALLLTIETRFYVQLDRNMIHIMNSDSGSDTDSCTMQDFSIGSDLDSDLPIETCVIGTEI